MSKTITLPIVGLGIRATKLALEFEASFAAVRKTADATAPEFAELALGFRDLAKTIPVDDQVSRPARGSDPKDDSDG